MPSLLDYYRPQPRPADPFGAFNSRVTYYAPGPGDRMEGGFETSQPNPQTGKRVPSTLDDVRLGTSPFVTLASDPSRYGQTVKMGPLTYTSPLDQKSYTLPDVTGVVHDTGSAFKGRPDKIDVAAGDFRGWSPQAASAAVTADAGRRTVTPLEGDEADRAMRPIGMPEPWRATGEGYDQTAVAQGPPLPQGRKMPTSLMDMFQPQDPMGQPTDLSGALQSRSNSLIGLGLGMMQPRSMAVGAPVGNAWTGALEGYQQGANMDARQGYMQAQLKHQKTQEARQAAMDRFNIGMQERQFARSDPEASPPHTVESYDPVTKQNRIYQWDRTSRGYKPMTQGATVTAAPAGDTGATPTAAGEAQPMLPPRKPLTAAEEAAVTKADDAVQASQGIKQSLGLAKELSKKAASGPGAYTRGYYGQFLPGQFSEGSKETMDLHNVVTTTALEQLKAVFGGNPTEGERKILLEVQGSVDQSDAVRQGIFDRAMEAADKRIETNRQRAQQLREGTYYRPGGGPSTPSAAGAVRKYNPATGKIE